MGHRGGSSGTVGALPSGWNQVNRRVHLLGGSVQGDGGYGQDAQGLAPDHVVYAGSASKTLAPGLRLGWFVLPGHLTEPMAAAKIAADRGSPALEQAALANFISRGEFDRHLRRMRPVYRRRRDALLAALARHLPWLEPAGVSAGLHLVTWLQPAQHDIPAHLMDQLPVDRHTRPGIDTEHARLPGYRSITIVVE